MSRIRSEPAVVIGIIAAAVLAAIQSLAGNGVISGDVANIIGQALDPTKGAWAIPIIVGLVTRFFVSPASEPGL
jgi:hypothetical protein